MVPRLLAMAVLSIRSGTPLKIIENAFGTDRINIPKAPALGLLLERPIFGSYNRHVQDEKKGQTYRDGIDFDVYKVSCFFLISSSHFCFLFVFL